jgi:hypothetical protein
MLPDCKETIYLQALKCGFLVPLAPAAHQAEPEPAPPQDEPRQQDTRALPAPVRRSIPIQQR